LIRLYPDEADQALITVASKSTDDSVDRNRRSGFVIGRDLDLNAIAQKASLV
jgi:hypothetical protein